MTASALRLFVPTLGVLTIWLASSTAFGAETIYKCVNAAGAVSFSAKPCPGKAAQSTIEPETHVVKTPVLPGKIPGRKGLVSPEPEPDTAPKHAPRPVVRDSCRVELFNVKRDLDRRFAELENEIKQAKIAYEQNSTDLSSAQGSLVESAWSNELLRQRGEIETRLRSAETALPLLYAEEKRTFEELGQRCAK